MLKGCCSREAQYKVVLKEHDGEHTNDADNEDFIDNDDKNLLGICHIEEDSFLYIWTTQKA